LWGKREVCINILYGNAEAPLEDLPQRCQL
jgi:hypothetical protein